MRRNAMRENDLGATSDRLAETLAGIDAANAADPNEEKLDGAVRPAALVYSERMTGWLERIEPAASELLAIAVRAQHIERWTSPRSDYPMTREGYLRWRSELAQFHAKRAGEIMAKSGYDEVAIKRVGQLITKRRLKRDAEAQTLEDVACLVFLENYFADFARQHEEAKIIDILRKSWAKMSEQGRDTARTLRMPPRAQALLERALADG
ncbi:MAG: DUF4202 domain-containing protein [Alphaproteobacteria bacterium]|nr:DUF4202 domain-containing protein [Alphaproteobacteria bacterium]